MMKKLINLGGSKAIVLPSDIVSEFDEIEMDIDTMNKRIILSW
jgi:hypothetical protein